MKRKTVQDYINDGEQPDDAMTLWFNSELWVRATPQMDEPDNEYVNQWMEMGIRYGYITN